MSATEQSFISATNIILAANQPSLNAVMENNVTKMEKIFKTGGIKQEAIDHLIFNIESLKMMKLFLRYGGDMLKPGPPGSPCPSTLLFYATSSLNQYASKSKERKAVVELVKFMIEEGSDVNGIVEITPLMNCSMSGETDLCKMLVDRGAKKSSVSIDDKKNALHLASESGQLKVIRYLVGECGMVIEAKSGGVNPARTPLHFAALGGHLPVVKYLLDTGAIVDAGYQALLAAAQVFNPLISSRMDTWAFANIS
jgi:ankyrin repeat protein